MKKVLIYSGIGLAIAGIGYFLYRKRKQKIVEKEKTQPEIALVKPIMYERLDVRDDNHTALLKIDGDVKKINGLDADSDFTASTLKKYSDPLGLKKTFGDYTIYIKPVIKTITNNTVPWGNGNKKTKEFSVLVLGPKKKLLDRFNM